jgi:hypothetical protein
MHCHIIYSINIIFFNSCQALSFVKCPIFVGIHNSRVMIWIFWHLTLINPLTYDRFRYVSFEEPSQSFKETFSFFAAGSFFSFGKAGGRTSGNASRTRSSLIVLYFVSNFLSLAKQRSSASDQCMPSSI